MNIRPDLISHNRPRTSLSPTSVTVHNTGNPNTTAQNNRDFFANHPQARVSYHWVVDDIHAIQCIPENEVAWHAGALANRQSIGVGVCEFTAPSRQAAANNNAAKLLAQILRRHGWTLDQITTHKAWTGKNCPGQLLPMWQRFVRMVSDELPPALSLNGKHTNIELKMIAGRTYAPVRALLEHEGYIVSWDDANKTVSGVRRR